MIGPKVPLTKQGDATGAATAGLIEQGRKQIPQPAPILPQPKAPA